MSFVDRCFIICAYDTVTNSHSAMDAKSKRFPSQYSAQSNRLPPRTGHPKFWKTSYAHNKEAFDAAWSLEALTESLLNRKFSGIAALVQHFFASTVAQSFEAVQLLVAHGYGYDAIKVGRGMFEAAINSQYLSIQPKSLDDFIEFQWIARQKSVEYFRKYAPSYLLNVPEEMIQEIADNYQRVEAQFKTKSGVRSSWSKLQLRQRAEAVGLEEQYLTFYNQASQVHHSDIMGLGSRASADGLTTDRAPSVAQTAIALQMAHASMLIVLSALNQVADFQQQDDLMARAREYEKVWKTPSPL